MINKRNHDLLFELYCEEIPARFLPSLIKDFAEKTKIIFTQNRLSFEDLNVFATSRRIVIFIKNLVSLQEDFLEEIKGPPRKVAYDDKGKALPALEGFAKAKGIKLSDLGVKKVDEGEYVFAQIRKKGEKTINLLPQIFPALMSSLFLPQMMSWDEGENKFIRPLRNMFLLFAGKPVKFKLGNLTSAKESSFGSIKSAKEYFKKSKKLKILLDQNERRKIIIKQIKECARKIKGEPIIKENLLEEVLYLVEKPKAANGSFAAPFLSLPEEIIRLVLEKQLKAFPVCSQEHLLPNFIVIADLNYSQALKNVASGYGRVVAARLADAKFFYEEDLKNDFKNNIDKLKSVIWQEKLGSLFDKVERLQEFSRLICQKMNLSAGEADIIIKTAKFSKTDLVTHVVSEFPELQGIMGKIYMQKESPKVAQGIFEHYLPRFAGDQLPQTKAGIIVSIVDKLDTIVGCFSLGIIPTGSEDQFALRRCASGIFEILNSSGDLPFSLEELITVVSKKISSRNYSALVNSVVDFFIQRLKMYFLNKNIGSDFIDAVISDKSLFPNRFNKIVVALNKVAKEKWFKGLVDSGVRVYNLSQGTPSETVQEDLFRQEEERKLWQFYKEVSFNFEKEFSSENFSHAFFVLERLTQPLEDYFNEVLVMHEDLDLRNNRLAFLKTLDNLYRRIADFTKIAI